MHALLQILCAGIGTFGFSLLFGVRSAHLPIAPLSGVISWSVYLLSTIKFDVFISSMIAAFVICVWSELMARVRKAPATVFLVPGIIPLLPGGALYFTMTGVVNSDMALFVRKGTETLYIAVGIAGGILFASELVRIILAVSNAKEGK